MSRPHIQLDSEPRPVPRLPFTSETGLQDFVETHALELLGIEIIAAARRGQMVSKIDLLGLDSSRRPWIIECKHDLVDSRAVTQAHGYGADLERLWSEIRRRTGAEIPTSPSDPGFILIGYRYDHDFSDDRTICLVYQYHDVAPTPHILQDQKPGRVSLHPIEAIALPRDPHPRVSKKSAIIERLERMAPDLANSFWSIDTALHNLKGVKANYGGKNYVRYSTKQGVFAEAVVAPDAIHWHLTIHRTEQLTSDSDLTTVQKAIAEAYEAAR